MSLDIALKVYNSQIVILPGEPKTVQLWNVEGPVGSTYPINALPQDLFAALNGSLQDDAAMIVELQNEIGQAP